MRDGYNTEFTDVPVMQFSEGESVVNSLPSTYEQEHLKDLTQ